ncbi:MAG TPA: S8 family peptidase [Cycloclasticus sp.]|jgi:subtilisin family serine protease|nr:S8 family peptidase [Cycloclasticus sp.]
MSRTAAERIVRNNPHIAYAEQNQVFYAIKKPGGKPGGGGGDSGGDSTPAQETPPGIERVNGGGQINYPNLRAWVIDTGIDPTHPDLKVNLSLGKNFITKGKLDATYPWKDGSGHGNHVAGTIAAIANTEGVVGVAPGAEVVAVRVLDNRGSGTTSGVIAGVDYVAGEALLGDVANMSLSGGISPSLDDAVLAAATGVKGNNPVLFALAAGNSSADASNYSPARVNHTNIYTVSAIDSNDEFAYFSNYGNPIDYAALGVDIKSTWKGGGYKTISGTSMAAPHVAGLLLLVGKGIGSDGTVKDDTDGLEYPIAHK